MEKNVKNISIHQTNVSGLGAMKFSDALVHDIVKNDAIAIKKIYFNKHNFNFSYSEAAAESAICSYRFGTLSRIFEVLCWRFYREQNTDILILGDLPLNTRARQYVMCQQSLIFKSFPFLSINFFKFGLFRILFKLFIKSNDIVLVQSAEMERYIKQYFGDHITVKILDLRSSSFGWPKFFRKGRCRLPHHENSIKLIYPSAYYPHKNHHLLSSIKNEIGVEVSVTVENNVVEENSSISCIGRTSREMIFECYKEVDGLLFLSSNESLGMPILEAIKCNLPIICPYAEYTKELSAENCFFFELDRPDTLEKAFVELRDKLLSGWWPNWNFDNHFSNPRYFPIDVILLDSVNKSIYEASSSIDNV